MDPRREAGLDEIVSNFDENSSAVVENNYQIYNCEINQCNGSLVVVTEEHIPPENGLNSEIPADATRKSSDFKPICFTRR